MASADIVLELWRNNPSIELVRFQWIDYMGTLKARFVPVDQCLRMAQGLEGPVIVPQLNAIIPGVKAKRSASSSTGVEKWVLRPDWFSLRSCGLRQTNATVMCRIELEGVPDAYQRCPRSVLSSALDRLERDRDVKVLIGFEIEVMLLDKSGQPLLQPAWPNDNETKAGPGGQTLTQHIVQEMVQCFQASSIQIRHIKSNSYGQIEFVFGQDLPLAAIDSLILAKETIREVGTKYNITATMTPKPLLIGPTNGIRTHMFVENLAPSQLDSFLAGILHHMTSICAYGMANYDSYARSTKEAAGTWIGFGPEHCGFPVRKFLDSHWEFRTLDGASNPYMFAAALLIAGISGLENQVDLSWKACCVFPHTLDELDEAARAAYGLETPMPTALDESLRSLKSDSVLHAWIGKEMADAYISMKKAELDIFALFTDEKRRLRFLDYY